MLLEKGGDERLAQLLSMIQPVRDEFREPMTMLCQGQQWMIDIAHILEAPLPELDNTPRSSARLNQSARVPATTQSLSLSLAKTTWTIGMAHGVPTTSDRHHRPLGG